MASFSELREKYEALITEFGVTALVVHYTIFFATWGGFWWALNSGFQIDSAVGQTGTFWGAYAATQATKIIRFPLTFALTPFIATRWRRLTGRTEAEAPTDTSS